jgi:hypothetical protein
VATSRKNNSKPNETMDLVIPGFCDAENLSSVLIKGKRRNISMGAYTNSRNTSSRLNKLSSIPKHGKKTSVNHTQETIEIPEHTPHPTIKGKINFQK